LQGPFEEEVRRELKRLEVSLVKEWNCLARGCDVEEVGT
jgi:hypothetical protein